MSVARVVSYAIAVGFWLATAVYAILSSQAFIVEQFLKPGLLPPVAFFSSHFELICPVALAAWAVPRAEAIRRRELPSVVTGVLWGGAASIALVLPALSTLEPGPAALGVAAMAFVAMLTLGWAEWTGRRDCEWTMPEQRSGADLVAVLVAALGANAIETGASLMTSADSISFADWGLGLRYDLLLGMVVFLVITLIRGLANMQRRPAAFETALSIGVIAAVWIWLIHDVVLASISWRGPDSWMISLLGGSAIAWTACARAVARRDSPSDGVATAVCGLAPRFAARPAGAVTWLLLLAGLAYALHRVSLIADWNFVVARLGVVLVWMGLLAGSLRAVRVAARVPLGFCFGASLIVLIAHSAVERVSADATPRTHAARWVGEILAPGSSGPAELFPLLLEHTNIGASVNVKAVDLQWAELETPPAGVRPNVFVIVVDSLRRDYLSAYNPEVDFTPSLDAFARESLVFKRAFTQYGATGLSVPSIWVGGPVLHKQYVTPFAPMNTLAKLLDHEQYVQWISMDNILDVILPASSRRPVLDQRVQVKDFRLCQTLSEMSSRLATRGANDPPVFAYTLPQDIHISVITREGGRPVDEGNYQGFHAPTASRVRRFDTCFGEFVADLERRGLYDESLIVVTSDHGDSLGEGGRMGHAYTLYPEIVRVPLIVHLPLAMRDRWTWDLDRPAYTTDVTPTLYRLLGHQLSASAPFFGESLVRPAGESAPMARDRMVAASYGSVYGAIVDSGRRLYVADAIQLREMAFDLGDGPMPGTPISPDPATRSQASKVIRDTVEGLAKLHGFSPSK